MRAQVLNLPGRLPYSTDSYFHPLVLHISKLQSREICYNLPVSPFPPSKSVFLQVKPPPSQVPPSKSVSLPSQVPPSNPFQPSQSASTSQLGACCGSLFNCVVLYFYHTFIILHNFYYCTFYSDAVYCNSDVRHCHVTQVVNVVVCTIKH